MTMRPIIAANGRKNPAQPSALDTTRRRWRCSRSSRRPGGALALAFDAARHDPSHRDESDAMRCTCGACRSGGSPIRNARSSSTAAKTTSAVRAKRGLADRGEHRRRSGNYKVLLTL
jgi:hypothetical protein